MERFVDVCIVVNPKSGGRRGAKILAELQKLQSTGELAGVVLELGSVSDAELSAALSKANLVIAAGGDGTVSYIASLLTDSSAALGVLPLGTANDFSRYLGTRTILQGRSLLEAISELSQLPRGQLNGWWCTMEGGEKTKRFFLNYASFGWEGEVLHVFSQLRRKYHVVSRIFGVHGNRLLYVFAGMIVLFRPSLKEIVVTESSGELPRHMKLSGRSIFFANIPMVLGVGQLGDEQGAARGTLNCYVVRSLCGYVRMVAGSWFDSLKLRPVLSGSNWNIGPLPAGTSMQTDGEEWMEGDAQAFSLVPAGAVCVIMKREDSE